MREKPRERGSRGEFWEGKTVFPNGKNFSKQGNRIKEGEVTTLYFTNFPNHLTTFALWERFARIWRVDEVYIPQKVDRKGRRFGFVRFWEVQNVEILLRKMEDIWFDTYKLRANLAMHQRGADHQTKGKHTEVVPTLLREGELKQGVSYKQSLVQSNNQMADKKRIGVNLPYPKKRHTANQILEGTMEVSVVEENLKKYEQC
ncbi:hypothetical protein P8452_04289 [Trifolium repens]|nr:hypothetical protein P8452_04289 [Trifolium repens]